MSIEKIIDIIFKILKFALVSFVIVLMFYKFLSSMVRITILVPLFIILLSGYIIFSYRNEISKITDLEPSHPPQPPGGILSLSKVIERASKGYDVSREQVDAILYSIKEEDVTVRGKGNQYMENMEKVIS